MASKEDDNKLRLTSNVNNDREVNIINVYKRLEFVLNNKTESFPNKVESLVQVWKQVSQCRLTEHKQYVVHLMDWLKLHTLNIVLTGDWKKFKDIYEEKLLKEVKHCEMLLLHSNNIFSLRCRKLAEVIKDPWGSPILNRLLNDPDVVIGPQEIEFFCIETGYLISTRLRKLCESHCEDLALNLVSTFMRCHQMAEAQHFSLNATEDQKRFILDVYIALLYKYKKTALIISTLKSLTLKEGLELLKRFAHKRVNISKIWRHSNRIAHLAAQVYITATVMKPPEESVSILEALLETWFSLNENTENLESLMSAIRRIIQAAESAVHMYIFCEAVHKKFGLTMKIFTIELYIRALTTGMNDLERQKNEDDAIKVIETTQQLAHGFLRLADVLEEHVKVSRECVLTSFSLQPTRETLEKIVRLAERSGYEVLDTGQNWKCKLHPPVHCADEICWKCDSCGDFMSQPHFDAPLNTNTALNEALTAEQLGLSSQLCDDLVVVLSSPRYQLFNWLLRWQDLHRLCVLYLNDPEGTKNLVTELKFLDIDYSMFVGMKREPEDEELTGIERGYEHYLEDELYPEERISPTSEDSISQDSRPYSLGSDGMGEHVGLLPLPSTAKSDPNVLKSLRLFRPNLKRSKPNQLESVLPPKVFVTSKLVSPLATAQTTISTAQHNMGSVENLSALMDKYIGGYSLLPPQPPKTFLATKSVSPHTTAQPTFSTAHHNVRRDNFHALVDKYLGYDTSRNVPSGQPYTCVSGRSGNWDVLGQCSSSSGSGRSNVVANSCATQDENRINSTREGYNFLVSNSNVQQDRHCSVNSSRLDNIKVEPQKPSMKQMFSEMEQALDYLKQHKNEKKVVETATSENHSRCSLNLTKDNQQNVYRNLNEPLSDPSRETEQSNNFIGELHFTCESNRPEKLGNTKNTLVDNAEVNHQKYDRSGCDRGGNFNMQNFLLDHKNSDSPEKQSIHKEKTEKNNSTNSDSLERQIPSRIKIDESSYKKTSCAISIPYVELSKNIKPVPSSNTENGLKHCATISNSCLDLSKNVLCLSSSNAETVKEVPVDDVPLPNVGILKNVPSSATSNADDVSSATSNAEDVNNHSPEVPFHCIETSKTVLPSASDNEKNKQNHIEISKNLLSSPDDDGENRHSRCSDVSISDPDVGLSKNALLSVIANEESHRSDVPHPENISKNLISASSGTENGELCNTLPVPCVDKSKNLLTFGTSDAKNEENHCLHEINLIDYKTSPEKHLIQEVENVVPTNAPKTYLRRYSRAKRNSTSNISDSETPDLERDTSTDWKKKFNLKEVHVILHRLSLSECYKKKYIKPASKFIRPAVPKRKQPKREQKKVTEKSENKMKDTHKKKADIDNKSKNGSKPWPLQDINPKVNHRNDTKSHIFKDNKCKTDGKTDVKLMNPCVVLKRLEFDKDKKRSANSVLANVPGLNDLQMIRPSSVDRIVQVVQVPGARNTTSVPIQSTQTSTQVTPHIQRIGQPRTEKPEASIPDSTSITSTAASSTSTTTNTSESSTLINILSQQIIRPGSQGNCVGGLRPRTSPLINILSQQIIKPATSIPPAKVPSSGSTEVQVNSIPRVISGGDQILSQLINPVRAPAPTLKTLVNAPASDHNRIVQFICKSSDGKLIPVTSFTSNKVVKVSMTQTVSTSVAGNTSVDENFTKLAQTTPKIKTEAAENPDTLPKFQQAFGKPAYQNNIDSTECVTSNSDNVNSDLEKSVNVVKTQPKNSSTSLNVQPVQGGVIYTRQMPVGQTINLIPPGRGQVFRIATSNAEQLSLVKDTVIHGKMSALLAAALQGKQQRTVDTELDITSEENSQSSTRVALTTRPALVQNARIVKPVLQIPSNVIRSTPQSNLSSTTLEQLREFDMVYKQVKERSSTSAPTESSPQSDSNEPTQQISVTYLNQGQKINCSPVVVVSSYCNVQPAASPSLSVTSQGSSSPCVTPAPTLALSKTVSKSPKTKSVKSTTTHTTKASPIPKPQQKPQEDEHTTQRIFDILAEYAEQLRNSPDLNNKPAPRRRSNPPTNPNQNAKRKKSSSSKKTGHCSNSLASDGDMEDTHTVGSEDSSCGVVQISVQEEEQPLTAVSTSETSEASVSPKQLILTDSTPNQSRSLIIADSNVGEALKMSNTAVLVPGNYIMPVSMVKGGQQIAVVSGGSKILATVPARSGPNMLLFQSFLNQTRKHGLPTVKYSAVQPISGIARNLSTVAAQVPAAVTSTSQNLTAVTLAQTVALQKINQLDRTDINSFDTELLLTIAHPPENKNNITEHHQIEHRGISSSSETVQTIRVGDSILNTESCLEKAFAYEEKSLINASVATSVIAQSISIKEEKLSEEQSTTQTIMALNLNSSDSDKDTTIKVEGRVQSVLVATGTSNGPMLFNSPPTYNKQTDSTNSISESNKDEYLRNEGKRNCNEAKSLQSTVYAYQGKIKKNQASSHRLDRELQQLSLQRKQAALERELRLQKSLSEECEDLGVDEPSTSDLFPEADLLFDSNHSPSFDQSSQDLVKRPPNTQEIKEETKTIGLFCDDEPMRTDFLFEPIEFQSAAVELDYNRSRDMTNGQGSTSNESGFSCEDNTLLQTCTSMSDVTIPSPISPDPYTDNSPPPLNKCKYKYSNRKKAERSKQVENWPMELSSSEDTTGSTELAKSCSRSPEIYPGRRNRSLSCEEDDRDLIGFAIVERLPLKEDEECEELHCQEAVDCPSGRGARRSVKKLCSCCNGSTKVARKRPASRPPTPFSHKKTVIAKKR